VSDKRKLPQGYDPEVAQRVLGLRRGGASFDAISQALNLTPDTARAWFDVALGTVDVQVQQALEVDRLDRLHMAVWPKAQQGDLDAVDRVLKISERRDKVLADPNANDHALRNAFDASAATSQHTTEVDTALIEAGRTIADRVDAAVASGNGLEATKALYLVPHMLNVLREMLATPASRQAAGVAASQAKGNRLAELRAIHANRSTG